MNIHLHIERLVLEGLKVDSADARILSQSLGTKLTELLETGGHPETWQIGSALSRVRGGEFRMATGIGPRQLSSEIARVVDNSLRCGQGARSLPSGRRQSAETSNPLQGRIRHE